jgi:hypothetical protein
VGINDFASPRRSMPSNKWKGGDDEVEGFCPVFVSAGPCFRFGTTEAD